MHPILGWVYASMSLRKRTRKRQARVPRCFLDRWVAPTLHGLQRAPRGSDDGDGPMGVGRSDPAWRRRGEGRDRQVWPAKPGCLPVFFWVGQMGLGRRPWCLPHQCVESNVGRSIKVSSCHKPQFNGRPVELWCVMGSKQHEMT